MFGMKVCVDPTVRIEIRPDRPQPKFQVNQRLEIAGLVHRLIRKAPVDFPCQQTPDS